MLIHQVSLTGSVMRVKQMIADEIKNAWI